MSIMPIAPLDYSPEPPPPTVKAPSSTGTALWLLIGLALGGLVGAFIARSHYQPKILEQAALAAKSSAELETLKKDAAEIEGLRRARHELESLKAERREWVTVMMEPGQQEASLPIGSILGFVIGGPVAMAAGSAFDKANVKPAADQFVWGVSGKFKPITRKPGTSFVWLNTKTGERLGPYEPLHNPEAP